jgi:uncharacterized membrane protein YkoI
MSLCRAAITASLLIAFSAAASAMSAKEKRAVQQAKVSLRQAIEIAQQEVRGGLLVDADAATVSGKVGYAIELLKDHLYDVRIDMDDGSILSIVQRRVPPKDWQQMAVVEQAGISLQEAIGLAESTVSGGQLISADVTTRRGKPIWDIALQKDGRVRTVLIDPASGLLKTARRDRRSD